MAVAPVNTDLDFLGSGTATGLRTPTVATDAVTKAYVDSTIEGLAWKDSVRVATTGNLNLASPGTTIDGITMAVNDRVLVMAQTDPIQNGIYVWNGGASPATRSLDASTGPELEQAVVTVEEGTSNGGSTFRQTAVNFTIDSGAVAWAAFGTAVAAASETVAGKAEIATQAETDAGTDDLRIVTPLKLANLANRAKRYATTIGDGSATSFAITHNLNSTDVQVQVWETGGSKRQITAAVSVTSTSAVAVAFNTAPASNAYRVVVIA